MRWTATLTAISLTLALASPAEAAKKRKRQHSAHATASAAYQGGVPRGPLYNGQDYLGDDPDPNIRSFLIRDLTGRYGGGR